MTKKTVRSKHSALSFLLKCKPPGLHDVSYLWQVTTAALFGLPMGNEELDLFENIAGHREPKAGGCKSLCAVVGRRGGKSEYAAAIATYLLLCSGAERRLAPGQTAYVGLVSDSRRQAEEIVNYIRGWLDGLGVSYDVKDGGEEIAIRGLRLSARVFTSTTTAPRGFTYLALICDETAWWKSSDAYRHPDTEIIAALKPGLATMPDSKLIVISSPFSTAGYLHKTYVENYGKPYTDTLAIRAPTWAAHPSLTEVMCRELEPDGRTFNREYGALFSSGVDGFFNGSLVEEAFTHKAALPPQPGVSYAAFGDLALVHDRTVWIVCHKEKERLVVDTLRWERGKEGNPLILAKVAEQIADTCRRYGVSSITADPYFHDPFSADLKKHGVTLRSETVSNSKKVTWFTSLRKRIEAGTLSLPDDRVLREEFGTLIVKATGGEIESIEAGRGGTDDALFTLALACGTFGDKQPIVLPRDFGIVRCSSEYQNPPNPYDENPPTIDGRSLNTLGTFQAQQYFNSLLQKLPP